LAVAAALGVLAATPVFIPALMSMFSRVFGLRFGFQIYEAAVERPQLTAALLTVAAVIGVGVLGQVAQRRWPVLSWALPLIPATLVGGWTAFTARGGEVPATIPAVLGLVAGSAAFLVIGSYWYVLQLIPESRQRAAEQ
jgi:hypothetical protein